MNKFQSQSDKPAAYFFVTSPSESSIELESHWSFFNQSWCLLGPAVPKKISSSCQKLLLLLKSKYKQQGIKRPQTWPDNNGFHAKNTDIWESQIDLKCNTLLSFLSTDVLRLRFGVLQFQFLSFSVWNLNCQNKSRWNRDSNLAFNHEYIFSWSARKRHNNGPEYKSEQRCGGLSRPFVAVTYFVAGACSHQPCSSPTLSSSHICIFGLWILHV